MKAAKSTSRVDFLRKLDEPGQRGRPRIEDRRPRIDMRDVFEAACQRLHQLLLRARRAKENARFIHPVLPKAVWK